MQESGWMKSSSRNINMPLPISQNAAGSHNTTQHVFTPPCFHFSFSLFLLSDLLLCSVSALLVHFPHRLRGKRTGGCCVPGSSVGHRGRRHLLQVYTTNSFMTPGKVFGGQNKCVLLNRILPSLDMCVGRYFTFHYQWKGRNANCKNVWREKVSFSELCDIFRNISLKWRNNIGV